MLCALHPVPRCSCPATVLCYHLIAAQMCFGVFNDATKKPNVTNYRKRARKDADKKSGKKKPRLMDKDAPLSQIGVYCTFIFLFCWVFALRIIKMWHDLFFWLLSLCLYIVLFFSMEHDNISQIKTKFLLPQVKGTLHVRRRIIYKPGNRKNWKKKILPPIIMPPLYAPLILCLLVCTFCTNFLPSALLPFK